MVCLGSKQIAVKEIYLMKEGEGLRVENVRRKLPQMQRTTVHATYGVTSAG